MGMHSGPQTAEKLPILHKNRQKISKLPLNQILIKPYPVDFIHIYLNIQ